MTHIPDGLKEVIMEHLNEYEREIQVMNRFSDSVLKEYFKIASNVRWVNNNKYAAFDIALFKQGILYAIVEVKTSLNKNKERAENQILQALELTNCRFGIITDNDKFYFYDRRSREKDFKDIDFESLVQHLLEPESISDSDNDANSIDTKEKINITLNKYLDEKLFISIQDDIAYDKNQGFYSFINEEKEKKFFQMLLNIPKVDGTVYRYTSLDTLFTMLNKGTYRMSGIVGMNDKSEIDYFDKECPIDTSGSSIRTLNETFISSCSFHKDDLTMWRLYGDDAKGVCLEFEIIPTDKRYDGFVLAPVSYAEKRDSHKALKLLKELSDLNVRFADLNKWKHFFKPYDYNVEKEIRLMFYDNGRYDNGIINRDWVKTWSHSIINPFVDFKLNSSKFPLQLKQILLGPKMPERNINKIQLEDLLLAKGLNIDVKVSEIDNYR